MRLASVQLARAIAWFEWKDLLPQQSIFAPDLVDALVGKYRFQKAPQAFADLDVVKGIEFLQGKSDSGTPIQKLVIYNAGFVVETRANTSTSKAILEEILSWATPEFNLSYRPDMLNRWGYVSDLTFYTDFPLFDAVNPALAALARKTTRTLCELWKEDIHYVPKGFSVGHDPGSRRQGIAPFKIEFRVEAPFSENKYFSEAPLPTDVHIQYLEEFEQDLLRGRA